MAKQTRPQKKTVERVMHEFKHGELKSGGRRKVKNPRQAVAIALSEAGASRSQSPTEKRRALQRTKAKEARGATAMARTQGQGRKTSARGATSRSGATRSTTARGGAARRTSGRGAGKTKAQLYQEAKRRKVPGRSKMSKGELAKAVGQR